MGPDSPGNIRPARETKGTLDMPDEFVKSEQTTYTTPTGDEMVAVDNLGNRLVPPAPQPSPDRAPSEDDHQRNKAMTEAFQRAAKAEKDAAALREFAQHQGQQLNALQQQMGALQANMQHLTPQQQAVEAAGIRRQLEQAGLLDDVDPKALTVLEAMETMTSRQVAALNERLARQEEVNRELANAMHGMNQQQRYNAMASQWKDIQSTYGESVTGQYAGAVGNMLQANPNMTVQQAWSSVATPAIVQYEMNKQKATNTRQSAQPYSFLEQSSMGGGTMNAPSYKSDESMEDSFRIANNLK